MTGGTGGCGGGVNGIGRGFGMGGRSFDGAATDGIVAGAVNADEVEGADVEGTEGGCVGRFAAGRRRESEGRCGRAGPPSGMPPCAALEAEPVAAGAALKGAGPPTTAGIVAADATPTAAGAGASAADPDRGAGGTNGGRAEGAAAEVPCGAG